MREKLKNDLLLLLNTYVDTEVLRGIDQRLDIMLSDYEIESRKTDVVVYEFQIPSTVEIYIVSKKIAGLSDKTLYLYKIVLEDFFHTVQKEPERISANDIRIYLYKYQKEHGISNYEKSIPECILGRDRGCRSTSIDCQRGIINGKYTDRLRFLLGKLNR